MPTTTRFALPYPSLSDDADVPEDIQALADALDAKITTYQTGTAAGRPSPGVAGRWYRATDTGAVSLDIGAGWASIITDTDSRLTDARTPTDASVTAAKVAASLKPSGSAAAGDEALRALGSGAANAAAGNDGRLSDARAPTAHKTSHEPGGSDEMDVDAAAATGSLRTLGTGATQAAPGDSQRLHSSYVAAEESITSASIAVAPTPDVVTFTPPSSSCFWVYAGGQVINPSSVVHLGLYMNGVQVRDPAVGTASASYRSFYYEHEADLMVFITTVDPAPTNATPGRLGSIGMGGIMFKAGAAPDPVTFDLRYRRASGSDVRIKERHLIVRVGKG